MAKSISKKNITKINRRKIYERDRLDPVERLTLSYNLLNEIMQNPQRLGYVSLIKKMKPTSKEPVDLNLISFKQEVDGHIKQLDRDILKYIKLDSEPNGIKK